MFLVTTIIYAVVKVRRVRNARRYAGRHANV